MKTTMKLSVTMLLIIVASFTNKLNAIGRDDTTVLKINGRVLTFSEKIKPNSKCKVKLYNENNLVDSMYIKWRKPFEFKLKRNVWYTIRITGEDLVPLMVSFNTNVGNESVVQDIFYFDAEMLSVDELPGMNKDIAELPVGHVEFNKTTGLFEAREAYTLFYKENLFLNNTNQLRLVSNSK